MSDARRSAAHVARNTAPIVDVLRSILPDEGLVLEVASGSGEHALAFARAFPHLLWQPTDADPVALRSVDAWRTGEGAPNLLAPVHLDAAADQWPLDRAQGILCINMIHISPWAATEGLMQGTARVLPRGGLLYLYGAFREAGRDMAPSNLQFDAWLKGLNPAFGVRDREAVTALARDNGLEFVERVPMPANNLSLWFRKR